MAKATLTLANGTKVQIEGTADDVAMLLAKYSGALPTGQGARAKPRRKRRPKGTSTQKKPKRQGPVGLITGLAQGDFFKTRKHLPDIQKKLAENGHIYAQSSLSPAVLTLTQRKVLRRLKEKKGWAYVRGSADI